MADYYLSQICKKIHRTAGISYKDVRVIAGLLFEQIKVGLVEYNGVNISQFGRIFADITYDYWRKNKTVRLYIKPDKIFKTILQQKKEEKVCQRKNKKSSV